MSNSFGRNINQLGVKDDKSTVPPPSAMYYNAIVEDIVINEEGGKILAYEPDGSNIGQILFREIPEERGLDIKKLRSAYPLETTVQELPLVGEQVMVYKTMSNLFYTRKVNVSRKPTDGVWIGLQKAMAESNDTVLSLNDRSLVRQGASVPRTNDHTASTPKVTRNSNTRYIRPNAGDVTIQGRFGNTIRFGSNLFKEQSDTPTPNILITAGQWDSPSEVSTASPTPFSLYYENINKDKSSIWMVSDQKVPFIGATALSTSVRKAHPSTARTYEGAQIFINSDRVIINSKLNEISLFSNNEINLSSIKSITADTESSIHLRASKEINIKADGSITLDAKGIFLTAEEDLSYKTSGNYSIAGKKIFIGRYGDTGQPLVLGGTLALWLAEVIRTLITPGTFITGVGPAVLRPDAQLRLGLLLTQLGTKTNPQSAIFNSKDNFTSEKNSI